MRSIFFCLIFLISFAAPVFPQQLPYINKTEISPGVIHKQIIDYDDTLIINVITAGIKDHLYNVLVAKATDSLTGRETVSSISGRLKERYDVIAAINADFFKIQTGGEPENNVVSDGLIIKGVRSTDSDHDSLNSAHYQFAVTEDDKFFIERFRLDGVVITSRGNVFPLNRINSATDSTGITLFNNFQKTIPPNADSSWKNFCTRLKFLYSGSDTMIFTAGKEGNCSRVEENGFLLSANNETGDSLRNSISPDDTIKVAAAFTPFVGRITNLAGGWGKIVDGGKNTAYDVDRREGTFTRFSEGRHPRSGIGFSRDSAAIYFITVDGRQEKSRGVSLVEFGDIMIKEGIYSGLNLDGGGSTTLVVKGNVVNNPSDKTGERPVGNCIILIKNHNK